MKILLTFKCPDVITTALDSAGIDDEYEREDISTDMSKFIEYSEYIRVEFDSDTGTMEVLET